MRVINMFPTFLKKGIKHTDKVNSFLSHSAFSHFRINHCFKAVICILLGFNYMFVIYSMF